MKCLLCEIEVADQNQMFEEHARVAHAMTLAQWREVLDFLGAPYPAHTVSDVRGPDRAKQ